MATGPDLFVVCKNCGSEVSPYITECPYCGTRLRKRAPKLEKGGTPKPPRRRAPKPSLGRLRPNEIPGIRADLSLRPYATIALVLVAALFTLGAQAGIYDVSRLVLAGRLDADWHKLVTTSFFYGYSTGYELVGLVSVAVFGWLLERRHGLWAPLLVFLLGAAAGTALEVFATPGAADAFGGNGGALALLTAWAVPDLLARRRGEETDSDLLGVAAFAILLLAMPIAVAQASVEVGVGGAVVGLLLGALLLRAPRRD
jgi:membrane associated rhomboid family serine protease